MRIYSTGVRCEYKKFAWKSRKWTPRQRRTPMPLAYSHIIHRERRNIEELSDSRPTKMTNHCLDARREIWFLRRSQCIDIGVGNEVHSTALFYTSPKYSKLTTNRSPKSKIPSRASAVRNNYANLQILKLLLRENKHKMFPHSIFSMPLVGYDHINRYMLT